MSGVQNRIHSENVFLNENCSEFREINKNIIKERFRIWAKGPKKL